MAAHAGSTQSKPRAKEEPLVVKVEGGFNWADAAIGGAAGFGAALTLVGGVALTTQRARSAYPTTRRRKR